MTFTARSWNKKPRRRMPHEPVLGSKRWDATIRRLNLEEFHGENLNFGCDYIALCHSCSARSCSVLRNETLKTSRPTKAARLRLGCSLHPLSCAYLGPGPSKINPRLQFATNGILGTKAMGGAKASISSRSTPCISELQPSLLERTH